MQVLFSHSVVKRHQVALIFAVVDYVRKVTAKSCKPCEYGSFEHLFFFFYPVVFNVVIQSANHFNYRVNLEHLALWDYQE